MPSWKSLMRGYGYEPFTLEGDDPESMHQQAAAVFDTMLDRIAAIQKTAREAMAKGETIQRPAWPMLIMRTPKGWTGPKFVDGKPVEGTWRAHQVPFSELREKPEHMRLLEEWMRSYKPEELFDEKGAFRAELAEIAPKGRRRMGMNAHANGGLLLEPLKMPNFRDFAVKIEGRGQKDVESTRILGQLLHAVMEANKEQKNFRVFGPDETASNRLGDAIIGTGKEWMAETLPVDENLSQTGRVVEMLSEHMCQGWLEGYLLTGRHGFFSCYEAFIHIVDSMVNQHAKWLKVTRGIPWRKPIASLNYLLSSLVWRQDHNGFSHQDPGFIDHLVNKKAEVVRVYLPPDANTLLSVADHCLRSKNYINLIVAGKQPAPQWLTIDEAVAHCTTGLGVWKWASNDEGSPDVVMACSGDVPTLEALAAVILLRGLAPDLQDSRRQRGGPDGAATALRASARPARRGLRPDLPAQGADGLRLPRLSMADSPAHLPAAQPRQPSRARLQGRGHHDDALRHVRAQQHRPLPVALDAVKRVPRLAARPTRPNSGTPRPSSATSFTWRKTATICQKFATGAGHLRWGQTPPASRTKFFEFHSLGAPGRSFQTWDYFPNQCSIIFASNRRLTMRLRLFAMFLCLSFAASAMAKETELPDSCGDPSTKFDVTTHKEHGCAACA